MSRNTPASSVEWPPIHVKPGSKSLRSFSEDTRLSSALLPPIPPRPTSGKKEIESTSLRVEFVQTNHTVEPLLHLQKNLRLHPISTTTTSGFPTTTAEDEADLDVLSSLGTAWKKLKQLMGVSPACNNGGHKNLRGLCECPRFFEGELCESIICMNNGTRTKVRSMIPQSELCRCPHPQFITGTHCQFVQCQNGGLDMGNGSCRCNSDFYTGRFCESYASSWLAVLGVPLICIAVIIVCCIVCRLDICPRRTARRRPSEHRRRYGNYQMPRRSYASNHQGRHGPNIIGSETVVDQARMLQENLLNDAAVRRSQNDRPNPAPNQSSLLVYRLEAVPAFNPEAFANLDYKSLVAPPPYEEAISFRCVPVNPAASSTHQLPSYSPPRRVPPGHQQTSGVTQNHPS